MIYKGLIILTGQYGEGDNCYFFEVYKDNNLIASTLFNDDYFWGKEDVIDAAKRNIDEWINSPNERHTYFRKPFSEQI